MRYLSKIIFIKSAHIPYAEVKLDGNVHFIGTQGVGKSTLLRALLFFYNADKQKLGIPKEKRGFDSFYFEFPNSYIIYEVQRETGAYLVACFRSQGRAAFRFIDAPYDRSYFIDENGMPYADWNVIRDKIGVAHSVSRIVDKYEEYRDIIFGNRRAVSQEFYKFAITESAKYQNIPRTIQNVFLNSKLDADFIKDTIINSMNNDEVQIDLAYYRSQVSMFEQQYNDIMLWEHTNKRGEQPVRRQAERVTESYRELLYISKKILTISARLNYAERRDRELLPVVGNELASIREEKTRTERLIGEEQSKYDKEHDVCIKKIGVTDEKLHAIHQKRDEYQRMDIDSIIRRIENEGSVTTELARQNEVRDLLTRKFQGVTDKYASLCNRVKSNMEQFRTEQNTLMAHLRQQCSNKIETLLDVSGKRKKEIYHQAEENQKDIDARLEDIRHEREANKAERIRIGYEHPNSKETDECGEQISQLRGQEMNKKVECVNMERQTEALTGEYNLEETKLKNKSQKLTDDLTSQRNTLEENIMKTDKLLARIKGSLYEWLDSHKPGWERNIGKVADEERVLYNTMLKPQGTTDADSFFGVKIDVSALPENVRTPEDIRKEREQLEQQLAANKKQSADVQAKLNDDIEAIHNKYNTKIHKLKDDLYAVKAELTHIPQLIKMQGVKLDKLKMQEDEWRRKALEDNDVRLNEITHRFGAADAERNRNHADRDKKLKETDRQYQTEKKAIGDELKIKLDDIRLLIENRETETDSQLSKYNAAEKTELAGLGVDTDTLKTVERKIDGLNVELQYIKDHQRDYFNFSKDKEELFDHENDFRELKREYENKKTSLEDKFKERRRRLLNTLEENKHQLSEHEEQIKSLSNGLGEIDNFKRESICPPQLFEAGEQSTHDTASVVLTELRSTIYQRQERQNLFKQAVNQFKGYFSNKNTFSFNVDVNTDDDYNAFAIKLCEFIDNNKINDFKSRISDRYAEIIQRISKEVGDVMKHGSEINKTINDINADFRDRNFAGVIKSIALQSKPSSDKLMQLLQQIKTFNEENIFNIGEMDLFSVASEKEKVNRQTVEYLFSFMRLLNDKSDRGSLTLTDTFKLEFRVVENDNDTGWVEKISNVGSDGTDVLVKAMVNIMLINVFKDKVSHKFGDFRLHCMMDEIGKLHPSNVKGILDFANVRNIYLVNSSPTTYNVSDYRYTYLLAKDSKSDTQVIPLITKKAEQ